MICKNCGRRTFKGEKICPKCGSPMPERPTLEEELQMNSRFRKTSVGGVKNYGEDTLPVVPDVSADVTKQQDDMVFTPTLQFDPPKKTETSSADLGFYGSFGAIANEGLPPEKPVEPDPEEFKPVFSTDAQFPSFGENGNFNSDPMLTEENIPLPSSFTSASFNMADDDDDDDDLVIPANVLQNNASEDAVKGKALSYDVTTKITAHGHRAERKKPVYESIPDAIREMVRVPKVVEPKAVASGTIRSSSDLPPLREGEMYVALNHRQLRRLKSRSFRGLGILTTLCLVIISAFCIWNYVNSFADPLVGRWKGNVDSQDIPISALQALGEENFDSTWEFNDGGSMYLNLVIKGSPVSLSGTYEEKNDEKGEQYLSLTLTNPMDGETYNTAMYYTITGQVLELNDMNGMGMTITLQKE